MKAELDGDDGRYEQPKSVVERRSRTMQEGEAALAVREERVEGAGGRNDHRTAPARVGRRWVWIPARLRLAPA